MTLVAGSRLGPYEIGATLGAGGMGEVFQARDTKLGRDVAIKVMPAAFAQDPERVARFRREAQLLASVNHPNIAAIHGLEEADGVMALALELAPGEDLAERLKRGALPVDDALAIAQQIASGLEAAHEKGIVHRDLKPGNVKLGPDGKVKILDFGLAKAWDGDGAGATDLSQSPTRTSATAAGMILGTAGYMSPEQARGKPVDKRADIWAFGVVLYEMLTGRRLFTGETVSDVLAGVLKSEVDLAALPEDTPRAVRQTLRRCLERDPHRRLHDIADVRIALEDATARGEDAPPPRPRRMGKAAAALGLCAGLALGFAAARFMDVAPTGREVTFERLTFRPGHFTNARFAPDGQTVFVAPAWDGRLRELFQLRPRAGELSIGLPGADLLSVSRSGELAVLLPRSASGNAYTKIGTLAVVSASGGTPRELADDVMGADWAPDGASLAALRSIHGKATLEFPLGTTLYETSHRVTWMRVSPTGDGLAFFEQDDDWNWSVVFVTRGGARQVLSGGWADWWNLAFSPDGNEIWFGATRGGSAVNLYAVDRRGRLRTLLAVPGAVEVHDVAADGATLIARVDIRYHVFGRRAGEVSDRALTWLEQSFGVDLSADGRQILLAVTSEQEDGPAVYLRGTDGASPVRLGTGHAQDLSRDGRWALASRGGSVVALPTGAGRERVVKTSFGSITAARFLPDGVRALVVGLDADGRRAARLVSLEGAPEQVVAAPFEIRGDSLNAPLSPVSADGRFIASCTSEGIGILSIVDGSVRNLPGTRPTEYAVQWSADGRQILVLDGSSIPARIFKVDVQSGEREPWRELEPPDRIGVAGVARAMATPDFSAWAYSVRQYRSDLYVAKGLR